MARFVAKYVTLGSAHPNDFFVSYIMLWEQSVAKWLPKPGVYEIHLQWVGRIVLCDPDPPDPSLDFLLDHRHPLYEPDLIKKVEWYAK